MMSVKRSELQKMNELSELQKMSNCNEIYQKKKMKEKHLI